MVKHRLRILRKRRRLWVQIPPGPFIHLKSLIVKSFLFFMEKNLSFFIRIEKLKQARKKEKVDEKEIIKLLNELKNRKFVFKSQSDLLNYIREKFKDKNLPSKEKIRRIAIKVGYRIRYVTRKIKKFLEDCPVCGSSLAEKYIENLNGEKVILYYFCKFCKYKTKDKRDLPIKFKFIL